ncbi:MAG: hypothetical protein COV44_00795 [Deltaproteobacteria bacterium CG11_big_fil_rev_8_21_14_0_20_45_16]|nr:MAG: hypothetical protein COV44_00795 [Deltaproteobacteria bacterium CG11_big_fil_rev_8_21_14_0_20_45_16]
MIWASALVSFLLTGSSDAACDPSILRALAIAEIYGQRAPQQQEFPRDTGFVSSLGQLFFRKLDRVIELKRTLGTTSAKNSKIDSELRAEASRMLQSLELIHFSDPKLAFVLAVQLLQTSLQWEDSYPINPSGIAATTIYRIGSQRQLENNLFDEFVQILIGMERRDFLYESPRLQIYWAIHFDELKDKDLWKSIFMEASRHALQQAERLPRLREAYLLEAEHYHRLAAKIESSSRSSPRAKPKRK